MTSTNDPTHDELKKRIVNVLRKIHDPEIPVNIYDLGLIYDLNVGDAGDVSVRMTLTSPTCPVADELVRQVQRQVKEVEGVTEARVELTWDPPWSPDLLSEAARLELNLEPGETPRRGGPTFYSINPPS
jgi:FeS assembly SUF system protein